MDSNLTLLLHLSLLTLITTSSATAEPPASFTSAANSTNQDQSRKQMDNILDALVGASDFGNWASILSSADPSILPVTATLFLPSDADYSTHLSPFLLLPYHIIPQRLSFADLRKFPINTRLPTLLPGFSVLITNNSRSNFSIDGVSVIHPDLYQNAALSAHGIAAPFDYTHFGNFDFRAVYTNATAAPTPHPAPSSWRPTRPSDGHSLAPAKSEAASLVAKILGVSRTLTLMGVLGLVPIQMGISC